nr:unnamed protein product [Callosobruchus analis]
MERTGYLCTENICGQTTSSNTSSSTTQIPLANDTMLIISPEGVQVVPNFSLRHEAGNVTADSSLTPQLATTTDSDNELNLFGRFSRDGRAQSERASAASDIFNGTAVSEAATTTETVSSSSQ